MPDEITPGTEGAGEPAADGTQGEGLAPGGKVDLTQLPDFRAYQSSMDRQVNELRQQLNALQNRAVLAEQRADAERQAREALLADLSESDPDTAQHLLERAELEQLRGQMAYLQESQDEWQHFLEYKAYQEDLARDVGVDPYDPEYQALISAGADERDLNRKRVEMAAKRQAPPDPRREEAGRIAAKQAAGDYVSLPPSQAAPPDALEVRRAEYNRKVAAAKAKGDQEEVMALRQEYFDVLYPAPKK